MACLVDMLLETQFKAADIMMAIEKNCECTCILLYLKIFNGFP